MIGLFLLTALYKRYVIEQSAAIDTGDARERRRSLGLTAEQCAVEFPGLEREIERAVKEGAFVLRKARANGRVSTIANARSFGFE